MQVRVTVVLSYAINFILFPKEKKYQRLLWKGMAGCSVRSLRAARTLKVLIGLVNTA
jgi:hypothetical protein